MLVAISRVLLPFETYIRDSGKSTLPKQVDSTTTSQIPSVQTTNAIIPPSPVFLPQALGLVYKQNEIVPPLHESPILQTLNQNTSDILKGIVPNANIFSQQSSGLKNIPSSNPESPMCFLSPGCESTCTLSDVGLDVAMEELKDLEKTLGNFEDDSQNTLSEDVILDNSVEVKEAEKLTSYLPAFHSSQESIEFNDVLGELSNLEDTLLELVGDILSGTIAKN